jgi:hypothetical protein
LYVEDMLIASKNMFKINNLKDQLNGEFKMKVLGVINKILGMNIGRDLSVRKL